ncbi:MAG TPA: GGDEF domain-containing protein [Candidatus Acidoferrales bacterium]|nr:GGDEF domain-containing protein [Candidatus Acidoferrales bacterium]
MPQADPNSPLRSAQIAPNEFRQRLKTLDRREWWLWSTTVLALILLSICVASFAFPTALDTPDSYYMNLAVRALVGVVLIFSVYLVHQQIAIIKIRDQIADQIESIAKVETLTAEVYKLAALDQLTGLYNRRSGEQRLTEEMQRAGRHKRPLTLLLLDVDGLKQVNDRFGHPAGDALLKGFSERLLRAIRGSDLAVRLGGDEFMVLLPECRPEEVRHVIGRVEGLQIHHEGKDIFCQFSRGWTDYRSGETARELIKRADDALYADKRASKRHTERRVGKAVEPATRDSRHSFS